MNSDPRDHVGPDPIRHPDPQPVAARGDVLSGGQLSGALVQTEVPEGKKQEALLSSRRRLRWRMRKREREREKQQWHVSSFVSETLFMGKTPDSWQTDKQRVGQQYLHLLQQEVNIN